MIRFRMTSLLFAGLMAMVIHVSSAAGIDTLTAGHADLQIGWDPLNPGSLDLGYELGANAVINGSVIGAATAAAASDISVIIPSSSSVSGGLSGAPGVFGTSTFWYLPQTSRPGVPFFGLGAEEVPLGTMVGDTMKFQFLNFVERPIGGEFIIYQSNTTPDVFIDTQNPGVLSQFINVTALGHEHFNWGFSKQGTYKINFGASATLASNSNGITGSDVFTFVVVPEPGTWALGAVACLVFFGTASHRRKQKIS